MKVVSILFRRNDQVCLCQRLGEKFTGLWSDAGGKVDEGEDEEQAAKREVFEEAGLIGIELQFVYRGLTSRFNNDLCVFDCWLPEGCEPSRREPEKHGPWEWMTPAEAIERELLPSMWNYQIFAQAKRDRTRNLSTR